MIGSALALDDSRLALVGAGQPRSWSRMEGLERQLGSLPMWSTGAAPRRSATSGWPPWKASRAPTSRVPTSRAPTTRAPMTRAPTTRAPMTRAPMTRAHEGPDRAATAGVGRLHARAPGRRRGVEQRDRGRIHRAGRDLGSGPVHISPSRVASGSIVPSLPHRLDGIGVAAPVSAQAPTTRSHGQRLAAGQSRASSPSRLELPGRRRVG